MKDSALTEDLLFVTPDIDFAKPPNGWGSRHDQLRAEFVIAANGKPYLSKLTPEEWKHAIMDMVIATGRDNDHLDRMLTRLLNRVAVVERNLIAMAEGKRPTPAPDELRALAQLLSPQPTTATAALHPEP